MNYLKNPIVLDLLEGKPFVFLCLKEVMVTTEVGKLATYMDLEPLTKEDFHAADLMTRQKHRRA